MNGSYFIQYSKRTAPISSLLLSENVYSNDNATKDLTAIFSSKEFDYSKPESLVNFVCKLATKQNSIILDSFAGSGTTAHAVLNMNKKDGGDRKFILIEMMDYADNITAERVKRVIDGYGEDKKNVEGTGGGFTFYELGEKLLNGEYLNENVGLDKIREYIYFTETKQRADNKAEEPHYLGTFIDTAYYFYYDKENVTTLDRDFLHTIKTKAAHYVIYADKCIPIANKTYPLPASYSPGLDAEAKAAYDKLAADAAKEGLNFYIISSFRSYNKQVTTYNHWVSVYGKAGAFLSRLGARLSVSPLWLCHLPQRGRHPKPRFFSDATQHQRKASAKAKRIAFHDVFVHFK